ncbi:clathrin coat assembly protein AP180-like isoform X9 [Cheilinus undulatus]|uniref:clathrin coat assembly protein AP180-like isoform X9 n=1 Tax=Cheilinus undulatus TaxID=241271 RepID=UPI001BD1D904|nr:clathrin coat assembly protein AP180-like isoform X9 [Cheilinus undulatus]
MSGQTLTDRIAAAQYQLTGSDMARAVCKATTHEVMPPKKKHLEYLVSATNTTNVNIPQMADTLFERATNASWVVVFKALVTTHHMCVHGNERFIQYLASRTSLFNLSNFIDKTGSHGYDMSTFIRRYGRYLNEKAFAYRQMAFDFTRVKKGAEGVMRTMTTEKLLKGMPVLQTQIDTLLEFDVHPKELNNGIINAAFMLLFKDLVKLFASYNDGIINLLEKYFKMKKSDCKEALEIYKRFLTRVTKIGEFMKLAETVGVDKNDIPDINYAPSSILESLETHMNGLEDVKGGKKGEGSPTKGSPTNNVSPTSTPAKSSNAVPTLQPPPGESAAAAAAPEPAEDSLLDLDPLSSSGPSGGTSAAPTSWGDLLGSDPFAPSEGSTTVTSPGLDLFSMMTAENNNPGSSLDVCFSSVVPSPSPSPSPFLTSSTITTTATISAPISPNTASPATDLFSDIFDSMPDTGFTKADPAPSADLFMAADVFSSPAPTLSSAPSPKIDTGAIMNLFGESTGGDATAAAAAAPAAAAAAAAPGAELMSVFDGLGDVMKPTLTPQGGDVDTSMANMASNLTMGTPAAPQTVPMGVPPFMGTYPGFSMPGAPGAPMMPMVRPGFPATGAAPGAPMSPGTAQSPRKPPPPRNALDDLNIKDFM